MVIACGKEILIRLEWKLVHVLQKNMNIEKEVVGKVLDCPHRWVDTKHCYQRDFLKSVKVGTKKVF